MKQYLNKSGAAEEFGRSERNILEIMKEIREHSGPGKRYGKYTFLGEGKFLQIRAAVMVDYLENRIYLMDKDSAKYAPPFDVKEAERNLGITGEPVAKQVIQFDAEMAASAILRKMVTAMGGV